MPPLRRILTAGPRRPWETESTRADRQRRVLPFLVLLSAALLAAALPPGEAHRFGGIALAGLGFLALAGVIVFVPWERMPTWPRLGLIVLFCALVALVRAATGGGSSGFGLMLLLVVMWQAVYSSRAHVIVSLVLSTLTLVAPILLVGGHRYPATEWREALLFGLVASVIGVVVHELVTRTGRERWMIGQVAELGRAASREPRADVCRLALELTEADLAVLLEPDGHGVAITGSAGREIPLVALPPDLVPPAVWRALRSGEAQVILDTEADEATRGGVSEALGMRAWVHQPGIGHGGRPTVDLVVGWTGPRRRIPAPAAFALPLLANEAAAIVDRAELVDRLDALTRQDPLTGLLNRRGWDHHLRRELTRVGRTHRPLSVAILDLDRFKDFNDLHGHLVGDQLLKGATSAWAGALRSSDLLARWGGEEFVVLMPETGREDAAAVVARMARRTPMDQTFSAGVVTITDAADPDAVVAAADEAVYRAKARGRNRIEVAHPPRPIEAPATEAGSSSGRAG